MPASERQPSLSLAGPDENDVAVMTDDLSDPHGEVAVDDVLRHLPVDSLDAPDFGAPIDHVDIGSELADDAPNRRRCPLRCARRQ